MEERQREQVSMYSVELGRLSDTAKCVYLSSAPFEIHRKSVLNGMQSADVISV